MNRTKEAIRGLWSSFLFTRRDGSSTNDRTTKTEAVRKYYISTTGFLLLMFHLPHTMAVFVYMDEQH